MAMNVTKIKANSTELLLPSHVSIVSGLEDYTSAQLATFKNTTLASAISGLSSVYLGINGNAKSATKATQDGNGAVISTTYYKKTDTVTNATNAVNADKATHDSNGNVIIDKYVMKTDTIANATNAVNATTATKDAKGNAITDYIIGAASTNNNHGIVFRKGSGLENTINIADTTYNVATTTTDGLMSAADKATVDRLSGATQVWGDRNFDGDLNNIYQTGIYNVRGSNDWLHVPADIHNAGGTVFLFVLHLWSGGAIQLIFTAYSANIYQRNWVDGGGNQYWTDWLKIAGTVVETYNG